MKKINVIFFFRKPIAGYHSIEELFQTLIAAMPTDVEPAIKIMPFFSKGFFPRLLNILSALKWKGKVNHITGDVHYISYLLPKSETILTIHDLEIIRRSKSLKRFFLILFWFRIPACRVRYITVISEFTRKELLYYINVSADKVRVIPNCLPGVIRFSAKEFNNGCPVILQVGTKHNKNIPNLAKALIGIPCKLIILGILDVEQIGILTHCGIQFENRYELEYQEVIKLYQEIDLLAFVSTYEGFGLPILEAQATGRVVVTSNAASMPEVAGEAAVLVDPNNIASIRSGIVQVINDKILRDNLIHKGLENVKNYHPNAIAAMYAELYREIISK